MKRSIDSLDALTYLPDCTTEAEFEWETNKISTNELIRRSISDKNKSKKKPLKKAKRQNIIYPLKNIIGEMKERKNCIGQKYVSPFDNICVYYHFFIKTTPWDLSLPMMEVVWPNWRWIPN